MLFENQTKAPAVFQCADFDSDDRYAVVIWKLTYDFAPGDANGWVLSADPMPITGEPIETQFGFFHGDIFLRKLGVDLCVLGHLRLTRPVAQTTVTLRCGAFVHGLRITGDRVWESGIRGLTPSLPMPFIEMDLSFARAYGGLAQYEGLAVPFQDNPMGRGYYLDRSAAIGSPLPNIEPEHGPHVSNWDDRPTPAGWAPYPMHWGLRARANVSIAPDSNLVSSISPGVFNNAHPDLVLSTIEPGERVDLFGVYDDRISFALPRTTGNVHVRVGDRVFDVRPVIDGVHLWLDAKRLVITHRANFHYVVRPEEVRMATLTVVRE